MDEPPFLYTCYELLVKVYEGTSYFITGSDVSVTWFVLTKESVVVAYIR